MSQEVPLVLSVGICTLDYQVEVSEYPEADSKQVANSQRVTGGGNAANTAVGLARLGVRVKLLSKVGPDAAGMQIRTELEHERVDCKLILKGLPGENTVTAFLMIAGKTRTIVSMPYHQRVSDLTREDVLPEMLDGVSLLQCDGRHPVAALQAMQLARERSVPVLVEAEQRTPPVGWTVTQACEQLAELLQHADYIITSEKYPCVATGAKNVTDGLKELLKSQAPKASWAVATLGDRGCVAVCRNSSGMDASVESGTEFREVHVPAYELGDQDVVDTTGAGDAFIAGLAYGIVNALPLEKTLQVACWTGAQNCTGQGARGGMPTAAQLAEFDGGSGCELQ